MSLQRKQQPRRGGRYTEEDAKLIVLHILNVVAFCHLQSVVHPDLKPELAGGFFLLDMHYTGQVHRATPMSYSYEAEALGDKEMHVKVGDKVKVISGRDKAKIGEITEPFKHNSSVLIKDIN